jgi:hypothetical protein
MKRAILALSVLAMLAPTGGQAARDHTFGDDGVACGDNGTITWTPTTLWPPNHKLHDITFTYSDPDGGDVTLAITAKLHSDVLGDGTELRGSGNTPAVTDQSGGAASDTDGSVDVVGTARGERSGQSIGGRTYAYEYVASNDSDGNGLEDDGCASDTDDDSDDLTVTVPHDCRDGACRP